MTSDYQRISTAIDYLIAHSTEQPDLETVARQVHLSPHHFQRLFSRWTGVSPKRFLQILTVDEAKRRLTNSENLIEVSHQLGLSGSSRLHDHFVSLEAMTPGEYAKGAEGLDLYWDIGDTPFGTALLASTDRGICKLVFIDSETDQAEELKALQSQWPNAKIQHNPQLAEPILRTIFSAPEPLRQPLSLYVKGTNFQVQVWRMLLAIQPGNFTSYGEMAKAIGHSGAARAVGTAVGSNPIALLIPCHRVIRQSGELGGYRWGESRKRALFSWEVARL
ncbi:methylated-DNA--[protein]-cysteine S-methyltransferase [Spongiibacter sp. KMU-158]|uniref:methylated-DNA--[protein]-cysteine S-methyltransferase n=1 Tax=Spongiibacter pelagi TaxID=2760804 RepID=A0A927GXL9_9GAMM|nr:methylated-DNA--[protein]-cysteine S-methyltransferase [Spongiibacter pelagi]MBD2859564.1 methylated-DNA--[protein]-cysteine S-methyltransferase [Spongiibacter pelagi]